MQSNKIISAFCEIKSDFEQVVSESGVEYINQDYLSSKRLRNLQAFGVSYTRYANGKKIEITPSMESVYNQSNFTKEHLKILGFTRYDRLYNVRNIKAKEEQRREFEARILLDRIHKLSKLSVYDQYREAFQDKLDKLNPNKSEAKDMLYFLDFGFESGFGVGTKGSF